jgi:hypothetical protein
LLLEHVETYKLSVNFDQLRPCQAGLLLKRLIVLVAETNKLAANRPPQTLSFSQLLMHVSDEVVVGLPIDLWQRLFGLNFGTVVRTFDVLNPLLHF